VNDVVNGLGVEQPQLDWIVSDVAHSLTEPLTHHQLSVTVNWSRIQRLVWRRRRRTSNTAHYQVLLRRSWKASAFGVSLFSVEVKLLKIMERLPEPPELYRLMEFVLGFVDWQIY